MKPLTEEQDLEKFSNKIDLLCSLGWVSLGNWLFFKAGKVYDLSAADLDQLERIEQEGLFVIAG